MDSMGRARGWIPLRLIAWIAWAQPAADEGEAANDCHCPERHTFAGTIGGDSGTDQAGRDAFFAGSRHVLWPMAVPNW